MAVLKFIAVTLSTIFLCQVFGYGSSLLIALIIGDIFLWKMSRKGKREQDTLLSTISFEWIVNECTEEFPRERRRTPDFFLAPGLKISVEAILNESELNIWLNRSNPKFSSSTIDCEIYLVEDEQKKFAEKKLLKFRNNEDCILFSIWKRKGIKECSLLKDSVTIRCNLSVRRDDTTYTKRSMFTDLSSDLGVLLKSTTLADITLNAGNERIPAHKAILAARSKVFAEMFQNNMTENRNSITIDDIEPSILHIMLQYLYTDDIPKVSIENIYQLYAVADRYAIFGLKKRCSLRMLHSLSEDNACSYLLVADRYGDKVLKDGVIEFFLMHDNILSDEWKEFSKDNPHLAVEVLNAYIKSKFFMLSDDNKTFPP